MAEAASTSACLGVIRRVGWAGHRGVRSGVQGF